ncbi:MAG: aminopeptidase, partial [Bacteroidetes bacterium]|nr:aminopeptidase [Bacteroidota bacterium]
MKTFLVFFSTLCSICLAAQSDSISINAKLSADRKQLSIQQEITFHNRGNEVMDSIKLLNWIAAYQSKNTPLAKRKLEDRNADMHYAKQNEFGGLERLSVQIENENITIENLKQENIFIKLPHSLAPKNSITIRLDYSLHLPQNKFTGYGYTKETVLLKYFFLVPDQLYGNLKRNYLDLEEITNFDTYWKIKIENEAPNYIYSNLKQLEPNVFATKLSTDPEILISKQSFPTFETEIDGQKINIELGYPIDFYENSRIALDTKQQFQFIKNGIGVLPDKIFISEKFKNKEDFFGNNDIKFWKLRYALFTPGENLDLDYFSIFSKKIIGQTFITNQEKNHWIANGIKSYLESEYLSKYYKNAKLLGDLPDTFTIIGLKPLKWFYASDLKLQERYGLAYQYMVSQNLDQAIATPYSHLSNFNVMAISNFETGSIFRFLADKNKSQSLNDFLSDYSTTNRFR